MNSAEIVVVERLNDKFTEMHQELNEIVMQVKKILKRLDARKNISEE